MLDSFKHKLYLLRSYSLIILILTSGCADVLNSTSQFQEKDCGQDISCFNEHLKYCENAKVLYTSETSLGIAPSFSEMANFEYLTSIGSTAKITHSSRRTFGNADIGGLDCFVTITKVQARYAYTTKNLDVGNIVECGFSTGEPNQKYVQDSVKLNGCAKMRENIQNTNQETPPTQNNDKNTKPPPANK